MPTGPEVVYFIVGVVLGMLLGLALAIYSKRWSE